MVNAFLSILLIGVTYVNKYSKNIFRRKIKYFNLLKSKCNGYLGLLLNLFYTWNILAKFRCYKIIKLSSWCFDYNSKNFIFIHFCCITEFLEVYHAKELKKINYKCINKKHSEIFVLTYPWLFYFSHVAQQLKNQTQWISSI